MRIIKFFIIAKYEKKQTRIGFWKVFRNFAATMTEVKVKDQDLQRAADEGMDAFLRVFIDAIYGAIGGELTPETMATLTGEQVTLLAWDVLHTEVMDGGFVQLIYNGYGPFIFKNPFAKVMKQWGLRELSKLVYDGHTLWLKYRDKIERELSDDEFMALFEQMPEFDDLDDTFVENEEQWTADIAHYVDEHIEQFVKIED